MSPMPTLYCQSASICNSCSVSPLAVVCRNILTSLASILLAMVAQPALEILENLRNLCLLQFQRMVILTTLDS